MMACQTCVNCIELEDVKQFYAKKHTENFLDGSPRDTDFLEAIEGLQEKHCKHPEKQKSVFKGFRANPEATEFESGII